MAQVPANPPSPPVSASVDDVSPTSASSADAYPTSGADPVSASIPSANLVLPTANGVVDPAATGAASNPNPAPDNTSAAQAAAIQFSGGKAADPAATKVAANDPSSPSAPESKSDPGSQAAIDGAPPLLDPDLFGADAGSGPVARLAPTALSTSRPNATGMAPRAPVALGGASTPNTANATSVSAMLDAAQSVPVASLSGATDGAGGQSLGGGNGSGNGDSASSSGAPTPGLNAALATPGTGAAPPVTNDAAAAQAAQASARQPAPDTTAAAPPSRTVTGLAAQIVGKLENRTTRFDVSLDPIGMGKVNVSIAIGAKGDISARLTFERPEAANAMATESSALRQALQDAGFNLKPEDLSFQSGNASTGGGAGTWSGDADQQRQPSGGAASFGAMNRMADAADLNVLATASGAAARGLDIRA